MIDLWLNIAAAGVLIIVSVVTATLYGLRVLPRNHAPFSWTVFSVFSAFALVTAPTFVNALFTAGYLDSRPSPWIGTVCRLVATGIVLAMASPLYRDCFNEYHAALRFWKVSHGKDESQAVDSEGHTSHGRKKNDLHRDHG